MILEVAPFILNVAPLILEVASFILNVAPLILEAASFIFNVAPLTIEVASFILNVALFILRFGVRNSKRLSYIYSSLRLSCNNMNYFATIGDRSAIFACIMSYAPSQH
ncbi:hypothetical protein [Nostoc sp. DSM 114161]|uniref:hypothetical protein n=1 Tax=Nostoc sp. DSM 114161 TaxID=3440143 RepID=UPI004045DA27